MENAKAVLERVGQWHVCGASEGGLFGERKRTVCSFCTESSKLTAPRVASVTLSYDEGVSATATRYNGSEGLKIHGKNCYIAKHRRIFAIILSYRNIDQATWPKASPNGSN